MAGLFIFKNKKYLKNIPKDGAFVDWLATQNINFKELSFHWTKEIGTMLTYSEINGDKHRCRPFNKIKFDDDIVIKTGINEQGKKIVVLA